MFDTISSLLVQLLPVPSLLDTLLSLHLLVATCSSVIIMIDLRLSLMVPRTASNSSSGSSNTTDTFFTADWTNSGRRSREPERKKGGERACQREERKRERNVEMAWVAGFLVKQTDPIWFQFTFSSQLLLLLLQPADMPLSLSSCMELLENKTLNLTCHSHLR